MIENQVETLMLISEYFSAEIVVALFSKNVSLVMYPLRRNSVTSYIIPLNVVMSYAMNAADSSV